MLIRDEDVMLKVFDEFAEQIKEGKAKGEKYFKIPSFEKPIESMSFSFLVYDSILRNPNKPFFLSDPQTPRGYCKDLTPEGAVMLAELKLRKRERDVQEGQLREAIKTNRISVCAFIVSILSVLLSITAIIITILKSWYAKQSLASLVN